MISGPDLRRWRVEQLHGDHGRWVRIHGTGKYFQYISGKMLKSLIFVLYTYRPCTSTWRTWTSPAPSSTPAASQRTRQDPFQGLENMFPRKTINTDFFPSRREIARYVFWKLCLLWGSNFFLFLGFHALAFWLCLKHPNMFPSFLVREDAILTSFDPSTFQVQPNRWSYLAAKGAINILTKAMALDMTPGRVRVNSVSPSWIWSPETAKSTNGETILRYKLFCYFSFFSVEILRF